MTHIGPVLLRKCKLKRGLRQWLETVPYVERVNDADQGDGGAGCSVIWLH